MDRRTFLRTAGTSVALSVGLAGCSGDGGPSLELAEHDTEDVEEPDTVYMTGTVENTGGEEGTGMVVGQIETDDEVYEQRREVTVPAGETVSFNLKFRFDVGFGTFYSSAARVESGTDTEETAPEGFHDLVVVAFDGPTEDGLESGSPVVTADVENRGSEERTATVEARVSIDEDHTLTRDVTVAAGATESYEFELDTPEPSGFYTYRAGVRVLAE